MDLCAVAHDHPVRVQMNGEYKAILTKNVCSVNPVTGLAHDGQSLAPYIPPMKQVGFTGQVISRLKRECQKSCAVVIFSI